MKRIAIAGGIGAGKTAVSDHLSLKGFLVVDADVVAHRVTEPGTAAWQALRDAFGDAVLRDDQTLDRAFLADVVFNDKSALRRLNTITHGPIGLEMLREIQEASGNAAFVALPLFRPEHRHTFSLDEAWAVQVSPETAVRRLCENRGFTEADARARLANQMSNEERSLIVDRVLWNEGTLDELYVGLEVALRESGLADG